MYILQYDKNQFVLTDNEAKQINNWLENRQGQTHYTFRGKSLMARKMEVLEEGKENKPAFMEFNWTDEYLERWENEVFENFNTFEDYLISQGAWVVNDKYPDGAVKDHKLYRELTAKQSALSGYRHRREEKAGHKSRDEMTKKIKDGFKGLVEKMSVEPISKTEKPLSEEPKFHTEGCEIQHTGKCNCGYKPNPDDELTEERKKILREIPF